ncbi:hypothetical protein GCM10011502_10100 [Oceanisphaera marina]|uniref:diguanylate cyclase n=1 Tax=Oceanisphaera marina TaxID=2017550 RepID=A0ABQ1IHW6_9GAMM|nr:GGDEF domain-containing protein [Oceanisphaera marina]GGB38811.1 hypothetical protein GCM10011502_10100 [Oceanisphaera marina]
MNDFDDRQMLIELASVIDRLEIVLSGLQQPLALSANDSSAGRLSSHWHRIFTGNQVAANAVDTSRQQQLASELTQQLERLRNEHVRMRHIKQLSEKKLQHASTQLQQSGFSPPEAAELLTLLTQGQFNHQHHGQLLQLLDHYQAALASSITHHAHSHDHQHELCTRLLQLIDELHFSGPVATELAKLRHQLQQRVEKTELPSVCLKLIDLTIEGCRFERKNATRFLTNLNAHLEEVHRHFAITLSEGQSIVDARTHHGHHIAGELRAIGEHLFSQSNVQLTADIELRMRSINHILVQHERLQEREHALLQRMSEMDQQIHTLKAEAENFKLQLNAQNDKLFIDSLTQIHNRAGMDQRLDLEYRQWLRYEKPLCIALLDVDYFKEINDKYGHLAGDKALRLIAKTMQQSLRETDFVARFGGEEFMVLLSNTDQKDIEKPLQKLCDRIKNIPFRFKEEPVTITISLGATLLKQGDSIQSALERADQALYRAKHAGRDQIVMD